MDEDLRNLEQAIYDEFDIKVKVSVKEYNKDGRFYYLAFSLPRKFEIFRNYIISFATIYVAGIGSGEDYFCGSLVENYD